MLKGHYIHEKDSIPVGVTEIQIQEIYCTSRESLIQHPVTRFKIT